MPTRTWSNSSCSCSRDSSPCSGGCLSPLPEVTPCRSRGSETEACPCVCGSYGRWSNGAHPSWSPRKAQGGHWHLMLSVTLLKRGTGACTSTAAGMEFAIAHHSGPRGINFSYDLHHLYDCSTFLFTLNCLEITTKYKIKKKII